MGMIDNTALIKLAGLSRSYQEGGRQHAVLKNLNIEISHGENVALLGRSGSGKSTLLNLISGIDLPDAGSVIVEGKDLTRLSESERTLFRRRQIGFIYQFFNLVPSLTAGENIAFTLELNDYPRAEIVDRVEQIMQELAIGDKAQRYPAQLSGGEQQRVAIARALVHRPAIVLADEPTGNLDARTGQTILQSLQRLLLEHGSTLLLVTHSLEVARSASRILTLEDGILQERESDFAW